MFKSGQGPVANLRASTGEKGPHGDVWWSASVTVADVPTPVDRETAVSPASEPELGRLLLELVESARAQGIDAERALRGAVRDLEGQVRQVEQASSVEA